METYRKTNFEQTAKCDELKKQYFYEHTNSSLEAINKKDIEFKFSFCKKLDNVSIDQIIDNLEEKSMWQRFGL